MFVPKKGEVTGGWGKLRNEELQNFYSLLSIIRVIKIKDNEIGETCSIHGANDKCARHFSRKT
jgi:hypothetical protein